MELFLKMVKSFQLLTTFAKCSMLHVPLGSKQLHFGNVIIVSDSFLFNGITGFVLCVNYTRIRILSGPHIPVFKLNAEICVLTDSTHIPVFSLNTEICGPDKPFFLVSFTQCFQTYWKPAKVSGAQKKIFDRI